MFQQVLEKNPKTLSKLSIICGKIDDLTSKYLSSSPKTAAEFIQQTDELFKDIKPFFELAPSLCREVIDIKTYLMAAVYFRLHYYIYNLFESKSL